MTFLRPYIPRLGEEEIGLRPPYLLSVSSQNHYLKLLTDHMVLPFVQGSNLKVHQQVRLLVESYQNLGEVEDRVTGLAGIDWMKGCHDSVRVFVSYK
jgi:hypothetical protein